MTNTNMLHSGLTAFHINSVGHHAAWRQGAGKCTRTDTGLAHGRPEGSRSEEAMKADGRLRAEGEVSPSGRCVGWVDLGLPHSPWAVRVLYGGGRRAAMEIHEHGELRDVVVESTLSGGLLRGARRVGRRRRRAFAEGDGRPPSTTIAWGRLPESGRPPLVTFINHGWNGRSCAGWVIPIAGRFWIACVEGAFCTVQAENTDGSWAKVRASRARATVSPAMVDAATAGPETDRTGGTP